MSQSYAPKSRNISKQDKIVVVMGPTGAGKSTFIDIATCQGDKNVGHGLNSHTSDIRAVRVLHPITDCPIVFVDTPGFDDTSKSDTEILTVLAEWLVKTYKENVNLSTIIHLHKISENRMTGSLQKNLRMFISLIGQKAMPNVVIATTMWRKDEEKQGQEREAQLKSEFWGDMMINGCRIERFNKTYESAWFVIDGLSKADLARVLVSQEIVDRRLRLEQTTAGVTLNEELKKLIKARKEGSRKLRAQSKKKSDPLVVEELNKQQAEIDEKIAQTADELEKLKIPIMSSIVALVLGRRRG